MKKIILAFFATLIFMLPQTAVAIDNDVDENLINVGRTTLAWSDSKTFKIINLKKAHSEMYEKLEELVEK